jgi:beta-lactamase class C
MAKWMRFLLGYNPELMNKSALAEAFNPCIEIKGNSKYYHRWPGNLTSYYGFGWRIHKFLETGTDEEKTIWHHGGSVNDYRNEIAVYPEGGLGICVLLNSNSKLTNTVIPDLYELVKEVYDQTTPKIAGNSNTETAPPGI